jgi:hypothetical protein
MADPVLSARGQLAAATRWARPGERQRASETARHCLRERFARRLDPDLSDAEREAAVDGMIRAHTARMRLGKALKSRTTSAPRAS